MAFMADPGHQRPHDLPVLIVKKLEDLALLDLDREYERIVSEKAYPAPEEVFTLDYWLDWPEEDT